MRLHVDRPMVCMNTYVCVISSHRSVLDIYALNELQNSFSDDQYLSGFTGGLVSKLFVQCSQSGHRFVRTESFFVNASCDIDAQALRDHHGDCYGGLGKLLCET